MSRRLVLPQPPKEYSRAFELLRNRELERIINEKVSAFDASIFNGIPFTALKGTNANFTIPQGAAYVPLPFDTTVKDTDPDVNHNPVAFTLTNPWPMDCVFFVNLRHAAAPGSTYDFTMRAVINGVPVNPPYTQTIANNETQDIRIARFIVNFPGNSTTKLEAVHNRNGNVVLNMALSQWDVLRISPQGRVL